MFRAFRLAALLAVVSAAAFAQGPSADWRTIETAHFRVHYPREYQAWSTRAAEHLESIRGAVVKEVGYDPPQRIDIVISNPIAQANGLAWPLLDAPRIVFYTEPPGPEEQIGAYSSWIDLLAVHEITHVVHMLRPSRNPLERISERYFLPLDPITLGAPRWVLEGYATVVEGRLTGAGRPSSTMRAVILRKWASSGRFPSYSQLDSDQRFLGMSMAYLVGSAYLEWLEARGGTDSLRHLWARMTARQRRSFDEAFAGVFGESPEKMYGRFAAEVTASAIAADRAVALREGELWQETSRASGDPAVSPDGSRIAVVIRERNKPAKIVIWSTGAAEAEEKKFDERIRRILKRDPEDVAPVRVKPLERKRVDSMTPPDGGDLDTPRWTRNGRSLLYSHRQPDREGFLHRDLFVWTPSTGENVRITHLADVHDADPFPDGRTAAAVRSRFGLSQLVTIDLTSGAVQPLTPESIDAVYSHPRVDREGRRLAYVVNRSGVWALMLRDLATGRDRSIVDDAALDVATPEWSATATEEIFATVSRRGIAEIERISTAGTHEPLTRSSGGAFEPAPAADGRVFFMGLEPDGFVVRVIGPNPPPATLPPYDQALVPALPPEPATAVQFESAAITPGRPYGAGRQEITFLAGENVSTSGHAIEAGARIGDIVGRLDAIVVGSFGRRDAFRGGAVAFAWRGLPVDLSAHVFTASTARRDFDGLELRGSWTLQRPLSTLRIDAGGLSGSPYDLGFIDTNFTARQFQRGWRINEEIGLSGESGTLSHVRGIAGANISNGGFRLGVRYRRDRLSTDGEPDFELGGIWSSILPGSALPTRIFDPALPVLTLNGKNYEGLRFDAALPGLPLMAFYQRHRAGNTRLGLAGLGANLRSAPVPLLRLPAFDLTLGVARILDEPLKGRTRWWFGLGWRP